MNTPVCIPLDSLSVSEEGAEASKTPPAVGDPVEFTATGTVAKVDDEMAYVTLESVNGQPVAPEDPAAEAAEQPEPDEAAMRSMAASADQENQPA